MKKKPENTITYEIECLHEGVTGSAILLIAHFPNGVNKRILVDCGTFQEYEYKEYNESIPFNVENIDYTFLTHTHIDHCGRLPLLVKEAITSKNPQLAKSLNNKAKQLQGGK